MGLRGIKSNSFRTQNQILSKVAKYGLLCLVKISFKPRDHSIAGLFCPGIRHYLAWDLEGLSLITSERKIRFGQKIQNMVY